MYAKKKKSFTFYLTAAKKSCYMISKEYWKVNTTLKLENFGVITNLFSSLYLRPKAVTSTQSVLKMCFINK